MGQKYLSVLIALPIMLMLLPSALAFTIAIPDSFTTEHNAHLYIPINVTNSDTDTLSSVSLSATNILNGSVMPTTPTTNRTISVGETKNYTIDYSIPQYTNAGNYITNITVSAQNSTGSTSYASKNVTITVSGSNTWTISSPGVIRANQDGNGSTTLTIQNTGSSDLTNIVISYSTSDTELEDDDDEKLTLSFTPASITTLTPGQSQEVTITASIPDEMDVDEYNPTISINSTQLSTTKQVTISVRLIFCEEGEQGNNLQLTIKEPDSDDDFYPGDTIPVEVKIRNRDDEDLDVVIVANIYDSDDNEWLDAEVELEEEIDEETTETFVFDLELPTDVVKSHDYRVYVKAYEDGNEDEQCDPGYVSIDIKQNTYEIKIDKVEAIESTTCNSMFDIVTRLANTGTKDEDEIKLQIINSELNINEEKTLGIDDGDKKSSTLTITIPKDAEEKTYTFSIKAYFHYYSDAYHDSVSTTKKVKVEGNCVKDEASGTISTELITSEPYTGEQLTIKVSVFNTGDMETAYTLTVDGYEGWAKLDKIEPLVMTIAKSKAASAYIYLTPNENASGTQRLTIKALYDNSKKKAEMDMSIAIKEKVTAAATYQSWATKLGNLSGFDIATVNAVLIIAVLLVIAWIARVRRAY